MENLDLDIQNYELEDILNLFKIPYHFNSYDLKKSYKMSLKTHPDKSGLETKFFLFFQKAYSILERIHNFRNKKENCVDEYLPEPIDTEHVKLLKSLDGKSVKDFNQWFNSMFEKVKVCDEEVDKGYDDWYRNYKDKEIKKMSMSEFGREFEKKRNDCCDIVLKNEILEIGNGGGYNLDRTGPEEYTSDIFSKLTYEDLKKAHTETMVPVSKKDFENKKQFNNIESYKRYRNNQNTSPLSLQQSKNFLKDRGDKTNKTETQRIYNILKQDERVEDSNRKWWGYIKQLE